MFFSKSLALVLNPLDRIALAVESTRTKTDEIHSVVTIDLKKAAIETHKELKKQTAILGDIRELIKGKGAGSRKEKKDQKGASGGVKMPDMMGVVKGGFAVVLMAGALVAASGLLSFMAVPTAGQLLSTLAIAAVFAILAPVFSKISESITKDDGKSLGGKLTGVGLKDILKSAGIMVLTMVGMATAIVLSSWVLSLVKPITMETFLSALAIAAVMVPLAIAATKLIKAMKKGGVSMDMAGVGMVAMMPLIMVGMATAIAQSSWVLSLVKPITMETFLSALAIAVVMVPLAIATAALMIGMKKGGIEMNLKGVGKVLLLPLVMGALALGIVAAAWAMHLLPSKFVAPPLWWSLEVGLALFVFSASFALIAHSVKELGAKGMFTAAFAIPIIALGLVAAAWIMQLLPTDFVAPPYEWSLNVGLGLLVFGGAMILVGYIAKKVGASSILYGLLGVVVSAVAILAVAWIFSVLPSDFKSPDYEWSKRVGLAMLVFGTAMAALGLLGMATAGAIFLFGAIGIITVAGVMWVVAWIFSKIPEVDVSKIDALTRGIMSPMHAMIDVLKRFMDDIGIDNMIPLALGIGSLSGAWLTLVAALSGQAIGGALAAVGNAFGSLVDGLSSMFGGKKSLSPIDLLEKLVGMGPKLLTLANPINQIAKGYAMISSHSANVIKALGALAVLYNKDNRAELELSAGAFSKLSMSYESFAKSTKSINIAGVKASTEMFNSLTRLAEANGEDAMSIMADKLMKAVSELSEVVHNLEGAIGEQGKNTGLVGDAISGSIEKFKSAVSSATGSDEQAEAAVDTISSGNMDDVVFMLQNINDSLNGTLRVKTSSNNQW